MMFLALAAGRRLRWLRLRRPIGAILATVIVATGSLSTPRQAAALTLIETLMAVAAVGVAVSELYDVEWRVQEAVLTQISILARDRVRQQAVLSQAMSCPVFAGSGTILTEDECVWTRAAGQWTTQSGTTDSTASLRIGGQKEVAPDWFVGGAFGVGSRWMQNGSGTTGTGQVFDGSVSLKYTSGPWLFAGAVAFSANAMHLAPPGSGLEGDTSIYAGGLRLRGAYDYAFSTWYLRPRLDLDLIHVYRPGFQLLGPSLAGTGLSIDGFSRTSFVATPMLELGGRYDIDDRTILRPYVALGASFLPDNNSTTTASFTGLIAGLGRIQSSSSGPAVLANLEVGLQLYRTHGFEMKAEYVLSAGNDYFSQGASLRGAYHF